MGKQVKIVASDPILSKNFKYQKRSKNKLVEKAQNEQQRAAQLKKKKEMLEVEKKVDQRIEQLSSSLAHLSKQSSSSKIKEIMFQSKNKKQASTKTISSNVQRVQLPDITNISDAYAYHFGIVPKPEEVVGERRLTKKQQIEVQTKKEIKSMFYGNNIPKDQEQQIMQQEKEVDNEIFNLAIQTKKQSEIVMDAQLLNVTKNFNQHRKMLAKGGEKMLDPTLNLANTLITNYFDHIYVENNQEEKIDAFRSIVIDHSLNHLNRCLEAQKGKGFTNGKILILTPFMGDAKAILEMFQQKFQGFQVKNKEKLDQIQDENDFFRVGLKIANKKKLLTYFSSFDHSQIIIASPVGLKSIIGAEGDEHRQNSFISSVEILYIDRASVLVMQNWLHLIQIFKNINIMPKYESLKNSIELIRDSFLQLKGRLYRQSIVFTEYSFPELNALKMNYFHNLQGIATSKVHHEKVEVETNIQQNFYKIELVSARDDLETRFEYFKRKFWDDLHNKETMTKVVLFTNSYFEYVKLKSFLERVNASFQYVCEHTSKNKVQSRLARFNNGQYRILLTTQRAFYFQICQVKKFHSVYFYSLPKNNFIYQQLINSIQINQDEVNKVVAIYTKYDMMLLERIVGSAKALQMVREYCNNVSFVI